MSELDQDEQQPDTTQGESGRRLELEATLTHHFVPQEEPVAGGASVGTKQNMDLAVAVSMLREGVVNERQLAQLTSNWTSFGTSSFAEHAFREGLATQQQANEAHARARSLLQEVGRADDGANGAASSGDRGVLSKLDPGGRVARLLGVADDTMLAGDEVEDRRLGARYTLLRKLGQGGLGVVWLARDENLQRYVALKEILRDTEVGDPSQDHFRREAEITGRLEHPGIVPIYQFGRDELSGKAFYVMRFMGRRTLQDAVAEYHERVDAGDKDTSMMLHRLLTAFVSVCHAVSHAHSRRIVHRDLKPSNVALDEFGQVTLLDWGLAKVNEQTGLYDIGGRAEPGDLHTMGATTIGRVIGTPLYMAPEQASGRLEDVDELTDVYGLGGMLYAILTGVGPHQATVDTIETKLAASEVLSRIVAEPITPPEKLSKSTPPELNAICLKALSRRPYLRYASASELAQDVERYLAGSPVLAYDAPLKRRASRWMSQHPTLTQAGLLVASLMLIAAIAIVSTAYQARERLISARHGTAVETARDLEANLRFVAQELERDLHFITDLPLMTAIIQSQRATTENTEQDAETAGTAPNDETVEAAAPTSRTMVPKAANDDWTQRSPQQWLDRQAELFDGFLNANPGYLMLATCVLDQDNSYRELARSERVAAGLQAHRVPQKQLLVARPDPANEAANSLPSLRHGEVLLSTNDQISEDIPINSRSALVLTGVAATFESDGDFFGINVIESDLRNRLETLLPTLVPRYINVCITDTDGMIVLDYQGGRLIEPLGIEKASERFPTIGPVFEKNAMRAELGDDRTFFATVAQLGSKDSRARIGIITYVAENPLP